MDVRKHRFHNQFLSHMSYEHRPLLGLFFFLHRIVNCTKKIIFQLLSSYAQLLVPGMEWEGPPKQGLYDPQNEHEACGVGFVVAIDGKRTHKVSTSLI